MSNGKIVPGRRTVHWVLALVLVLSAAVNGHRIKTRLLDNTNVSIAQANADLSCILGPGAVVAGPYAPVLTLDNDLRSFIYYFAVTEVDSTLFQRYPITHLAVDESNWSQMEKDYPRMKNLTSVTVYWIRDYAIRIFNISRIYGNEEASRYEETAYERGARYYGERKLDSAYIEISQCIKSAPLCRSVNLLWAELLVSSRNYSEAVDVITGLVSRHPTDYYTNLTCGRLLQIVGHRTRNRYLLTVAERYYQKAVESNPYKADYSMNLYLQTEQLLRSAGQTGP